MKNYILALSALFLLSSCGSNGLFKKKADVTDYAASITQDDLREHLTIYASDEFAGRDTGTEGETKAINYLRDQYKAMGVTSPMSDYFQNVPLFKSGAAQSTVSVGDDTFTLGEDYINYFSAKSCDYAAGRADERRRHLHVVWNGRTIYVVELKIKLFEALRIG